MSEELKKKADLVKEKFENFSNFIELPNFRSFLLFTLTSQVPMNVLAQFGLGGNKEVISLPYNPILKIYYQKINLISAGSLIVYVKSDPISPEFLLKKDNAIIKEFLNPNEMNLAFRGKEKFLLPMISDYSTYNEENNSKLRVKIDDVFHSLESFLAVAEPNLLFVLDGKASSEPDLIFTFNMMPEMPSKSDEKVLKIDIFVDTKHNTENITYIKREEDFIIKYLKDIKDTSHSDIYKSAYSLILHLKSFNKP
ncbi:MAG: hypothetical protein ACXADY_27100 [Candidatus Hodarchaeales archaeon]|jgi:hypothetical protein